LIDIAHLKYWSLLYLRRTVEAGKLVPTIFEYQEKFSIAFANTPSLEINRRKILLALMVGTFHYFSGRAGGHDRALEF